MGLYTTILFGAFPVFFPKMTITLKKEKKQLSKTNT